MKCNICDNKLDNFIPDPTVRGGIRPCTKCESISSDAVMDTERLYDDSDGAVEIDIDLTVANESEIEYHE